MELLAEWMIRDEAKKAEWKWTMGLHLRILMFWCFKCCEILKYSQVYEPYQSIVGQERGRTHRDLNERRKIKSNLNQINRNLV